MRLLLVTSMLLLVPALLTAECGSGYQSAKIVKILNGGSATARGPAPADEEPASKTPPVRTVIFASGQETYTLKLATEAAADLKAGDTLCWSRQGDQVRVTTQDGRALPGLAQPFRKQRITQ